jgi:hypothetical protein
MAEGACDCDGNVLDFCGDCGGTGETLDDCVEGYQLYFGNVDEANGTAEVWYSAEGEVGAAQFDVSGVTLTGASGGEAEDAGWIVNTSSFTWQSVVPLSGATIPSEISCFTIPK